MRFETLEILQRRLRDIRKLQSRSLSEYFIDSTSTGQGVGFRHIWNEKLPEDGKKSWSGASTATCIVSLISTGAWWTDIEKKTEKPWASYSAAILDEFCTIPAADWNSAELGPGNPFTVAFTLEAIRHLLSDPDLPREVRSKAVSRVSEAETLLLGTLANTRGEPHSVNQYSEIGAPNIAYYPPTSFLTQLLVRSVGADKLTSRSEVVGWCRRQIEHELALHGAPASARDPLSLAYSVAAFASLANPVSLSPADLGLMARAIDSFFDAQLPDGSWPRSKPLHHYKQFGNAYCYEYETLAQLLREELLWDLLIPKIAKLRRTALALDIKANLFSDGGKAWASGHHPHLPGAESWSTASVYQFVFQLDRLLAEAIRKAAFVHVGSEYVKPDEKRTANDEFSPKGFLDSTFFLDSERSLRETVQNQLLRPILRNIQYIKRGDKLPKETTNISAILFGPPGTSKTTLAKNIAEHLGWPLLSIDPSHLFKSGTEQVQSESNRLFNMLAALERTVVFFDEFDELTRERTSAKADLTSRFLTTAMLPKLTRIADQRRIVFLLATNHIEDFDFAISRPGRFDMILPVMPPSLKEKLKEWSAFGTRVQALINQPVPNYNKTADTLTLGRVLDSLTYDEFKTLVEATSSATEPELVEEIRKLWVDRATLGKPAIRIEDDSQILLDLYNAQNKRFARIRMTRAS